MKVYRNLDKIKRRGVIEPNSMVLGDCLDVMPLIEEGRIDLCLTDAPYGITAPKWDLVISYSDIWVELKRVVKSMGVTVLSASQPFTTKLICSNQKNFKYCWYWIKNQGTNFFHAKRMPIRKVEELCVFAGSKSVYNPQHTEGHVSTNSAKGCSNGKAYYGSGTRDYVGGATTRFPVNILVFDCVNNYDRVHSSQKPVKLMEYLIKTYTNEGDLVLDFAAGSFTTAIACMNTNRKFIMIEKDKEFFEVGVNRVKNHWEELKRAR